jgi:hypothetical protein
MKPAVRANAQTPVQNRIEQFAPARQARVSRSFQVNDPDGVAVEKRFLFGE